MSYKKAKDKLIQLQIELELSIKKVDHLPAQFHLISQDIIQKLRALNGIQLLEHYLKVWFRSYLGIKDELMVLLTGETIRKYHKTIHSGFIHPREDEVHYYHKKCLLSAKSADGIDYEYRKIIQDYGNKTSLDVIADRSQLHGEQLHALIKSLDNGVGSIEKLFTNFYDDGIICDSKIITSHKAENISIKLKVEGQVQELIILRSQVTNCSQVEALSTTIDEPDESLLIDVNKLNQEKVTTHRKKIVVYDSDEEKDRQIEYLQKKIESEMIAASQLAKQNEFHIDISLNDIKKTYGASSTLIDVEEDEDEDDTVGMDLISSDPVNTIDDFLTIWTASSNVSNNFNNQKKWTLGLKIILPTLNSKLTDGFTTDSIKLAMEFHYFPMATNPNIQLYTNEIFIETQKLILFHSEIHKKDRNEWQLIYPLHIQVDRVIYEWDRVVTIPLLDSNGNELSTLKKKRYPLSCCGSEVVQGLLSSIKSFVMNSTVKSFDMSWDESIQSRKEVIWDHVHIINDLCHQLLHLSNGKSLHHPLPIEESSSSGIVQSYDIVLDFSKQSQLILHPEMMQIIMKSLQLQSSKIQFPTSSQINISRSELFFKDLPVLLPHVDSIVSKSCGVSYDALHHLCHTTWLPYFPSSILSSPVDISNDPPLDPIMMEHNRPWKRWKFSTNTINSNQVYSKEFEMNCKEISKLARNYQSQHLDLSYNCFMLHYEAYHLSPLQLTIHVHEMQREMTLQIQQTIKPFIGDNLLSVENMDMVNNILPIDCAWKQFCCGFISTCHQLKELDLSYPSFESELQGLAFVTGIAVSLIVRVVSYQSPALERLIIKGLQHDQPKACECLHWSLTGDGVCYVNEIITSGCRPFPT